LVDFFQDFITSGESADIIKRGSPKLKRSGMLGNSKNGTMDDRRVSEQTWLTESDTPAMQR